MKRAVAQLGRASEPAEISAGGDAVDARQWWAPFSLPSAHAETGVSQVQILPARPSFFSLDKFHRFSTADKYAFSGF
jgi:hypothetical protein